MLWKMLAILTITVTLISCGGDSDHVTKEDLEDLIAAIQADQKGGAQVDTPQQPTADQKGDAQVDTSQQPTTDQPADVGQQSGEPQPVVPREDPIIPDDSFIVPRSSHIAFSKQADGAYNIFVMNDVGGFVSQMTFRNRDCTYAAWSPDRTEIAFCSSPRPHESGIYIINTDGIRQFRVFLTNERPASINHPSWSPDGERIVFATFQGIVVMNRDGSNPTNITNRRGETPDWSPDGSKIVFSSGFDGNYNLFTVSPEGGKWTRITVHPGNEENPDWSPDGKSITFSSKRDDLWGIYTIGSDGQNEVYLGLPDRHARDPSWSPDGNKIAFESKWDIFIMAADGTNVLNVTDTPDVTEKLPAWY